MITFKIRDPDDIKVLLIVVTYNSGGFVGKLCESLEVQLFDLSKVLLVVVDNNSGDGTYENFKHCIEVHLKAKGINYLLIKLGSNLGFAPANNIGLYLAKHFLKTLKDRTIILLNPDTYILKRTFIEKASLLSRRIPIIGFSTVSGGSNNIVDSIGANIDFLGNPQDILCGVKITDFTKKLLRRLPLIYSVPYVCFASVAIRGDVVEKIGFLRNNYVIYFEDTEFCLRAWSSGIPVYIYKDFMVWHARGGTYNSQLFPVNPVNDEDRAKDVLINISYYFSRNQLLLTYEYLGVIKYLTRLSLYALAGLLVKQKYLAFSIVNSLSTIFKDKIKRKRLPKGLVSKNPKTWALLWALKYFINHSRKGLGEAIAYGVKRSSFEYLRLRFVRSISYG